MRAPEIRGLLEGQLLEGRRFGPHDTVGLAREEPLGRPLLGGEGHVGAAALGIVPRLALHFGKQGLVDVFPARDPRQGLQPRPEIARQDAQGEGHGIRRGIRLHVGGMAAQQARKNVGRRGIQLRGDRRSEMNQQAEVNHWRRRVFENHDSHAVVQLLLDGMGQLRRAIGPEFRSTRGRAAGVHRRDKAEGQEARDQRAPFHGALLFAAPGCSGGSVFAGAGAALAAGSSAVKTSTA